MNSHEAVNESLLSAYLDGEVTTAESAQIEQLLRENDLYQQAFEEMKLLRTGMQQLPQHQLGEGFARSVLETAERYQPLPDEERVDRKVDPAEVPGRSIRSWVATRWQGLVLGLATAAALVLAVRLMLPEQADNLATRNDQTENQQDPSGQDLAGRQDAAKSSDSSSDSAKPLNPGSQDPGRQDPGNKGLAGTDGPDAKSTSNPGNPDRNETVPAVNNPVVAKPRPEIPGLEQLAGNRLLFVVEVAMTPAGVQNRRMDQILMNHGILYDRAIEVDRPLEQAILKSRHLKGVVAKRDNESDDYMKVDLIYVVCNGQQVDDTTSALSGFPKDIAGHRFNLAMLPNEVQTFKSLHETVAAQWKREAVNEKKVTEFKARAGRLMADLVLLSRVARPLGTTSLLKVEPVPLPDKPNAVPLPQQPALVPGDGGETMKCEVLFVVRHLPAVEQRK